ncbi:uncharacterized protein LOC141822875 [Curcuma longa]|uniref:uncharacterized protein LOC141822875 n=1 Tax=Curcuma longa TaxID=136217 RepID=UPI003D9E1EB5
MEKAAGRGASRSRGLKHRIIRMLLRSPCSTCIASDNGAKLSGARPLVHLERRKQTRWPMASLEEEEEEEEEEKRRMEWFDNGEAEEELGSLYCNYYGGNERPRRKSRRRSGSGRGSCVEGEEEEAAGGFFAVPTRSSDPYSDFWRSMAEMVVAGQHMGSAKEMEKLLRSYLSLNSPVHHPVIVAAFVDVWEVFMA